MTAPVKYREKMALDEQPCVEVDVFSIPSWGAPQDNPAGPSFHVVRYPDLTQTGIPGREYIVDTLTLERHFELVLPQTFRVQAWGGVYERPMKKQVELDDRLDAERDTLPYGQSIDVPTASEELRAASEELQSTGDFAEPSGERAAADESVTNE